jgi:predicted MFS family arabinose efflux permease
MAGLFGAVVLVLMLMEPTPPRPRETTTSVKTDLAEGFQYIWRTPDVRLLALIFVGIVLSGFSYQTIMPGYLENTLGHPASHLGLLYGATAAGGIAVTLALAARRPADPGRAMIGFGAALAVALAALAVAPGFAVALAVGAGIGAASSGFQMLNNVNLMERTDPIYFGRVMAVTMMAFGVNSMVAYPIGAIADAAGERATLAGLALACTAVVAAGYVAMRSVPRRAAAAVAAEAGLGGR